MLKLYYADVSALPDIPEDAAWLSDYRRQRLHGQKLAASRRESLGAELLLLFALRAEGYDRLPPELIRGEYGKPGLRGAEWQFSLSHSGELAACAISDREIGLDVQELLPYHPALVKRFFAQEEREILENAEDRDLLFTRIWAEKESRIKALGTGLLTPLNAFSCFDGSAVCWTEILDGAVFSLCDLRPEAPTPESVCKLSVEELLLLPAVCAADKP